MICIKILIFLACNQMTCAKFYHRLSKVECGSSAKVTKMFCYIKAYNRRYPLLNFGFTLNEKLPDAMVCS